MRAASLGAHSFFGAGPNFAMKWWVAVWLLVPVIGLVVVWLARRNR